MPTSVTTEKDARAARTPVSLPVQIGVAPFDQWTYSDVLAQLYASLIPNYTVVRDYAVKHEHFRGGDEWIGPGNGKKNEKIEEQFTADDVIGALLTNVENAFNEAQISFVPLKPVPEGSLPDATTQSRIKEAESELFAWWDARRLQDLIINRVKTSAWNGTCMLRAWIPSRYMLKAGEEILLRRASSISEAFQFIHVQAPDPAQGGFLVHEDTQDRCAVYFSEEETWTNGIRTAVKRVEMVYLDPARTSDTDADTVIRVVYDNGAPEMRATLPLGGHLTASEMRSAVLITDPVVRSQRQLNFYCTMLTRLVETAGFRARYLGNVKPLSGKRELWIEGAAIPAGGFLERDDENRIWVVVPEPRTMGSATTQELVGLERVSQTGEQMGHETPFVFVEEPVDPTPYIEAAESIRKRGMRMGSQGHLAMNSTAEASGFAYEQSRATFEKDLNRRRTNEEGMLREFLISVFHLVELLTGKPGYFTQHVSIEVSQHVDAGPRSPDTVRLEMEANEKGLLSDETTMSRMSVENPLAETLRVRRSLSFKVRFIELALELSQRATWESIAELFAELKIPADVVEAAKKLKELPQPVKVAGEAGTNEKGSQPTSEDGRATGSTS